MSGWRAMQQGRTAAARRRTVVVRHVAGCALYVCTCRAAAVPVKPGWSVVGEDSPPFHGPAGMPLLTEQLRARLLAVQTADGRIHHPDDVTFVITTGEQQ